MGVCVGGSIFRIGRGVSGLRVLGSRLWRVFGCGFVGSGFLGFVLCVVFGLFGLGGMLRRRIFGLCLLGFVVVCGVWGFFCGRLLGLFVLLLGRVCLLGFGGIVVVFWFCPSRILIRIRMLFCFFCRSGLFVSFCPSS